MNYIKISKNNWNNATRLWITQFSYLAAMPQEAARVNVARLLQNRIASFYFLQEIYFSITGKAAFHE